MINEALNSLLSLADSVLVNQYEIYMQAKTQQLSCRDHANKLYIHRYHYRASKFKINLKHGSSRETILPPRGQIGLSEGDCNNKLLKLGGDYAC